jgi:hypothetical protein
LVNLQGSQWSPNEHYLNFGLWALFLGEPLSLAESKFHFRTRAEDVGATDLASFFGAINNLQTITDVRDAEKSGRLTGLMTKELRDALG